MYGDCINFEQRFIQTQSVMKNILVLTAIFCSCVLCAQSTEGLIAHYPFNGSATDASENGHHGTIYGTEFTENRYGEAGQAVFFDGFDDYINVPDAEGLRLSGSYTISTWVNLAGYDSGIVNTILSKRVGAGNTGYLFFITGNEHTLGIPAGTCVMVVSGGSDPYTVTEAAIEEEAWTHILFDYDADNNVARTCFNLQQDSEQEIHATNADTAVELKIGIDSPNQNSDFAFKGAMDDLRIYNRILTEEERMELFLEGNVNEVEAEQSAVSFSVFPNPTGGQFVLKAENSSAVQNVRIVDLQGKIIRDYRFRADLEIDLTSQTAGVYMVILQNARGEIIGSKKIVKSSNTKA